MKFSVESDDPCERGELLIYANAQQLYLALVDIKDCISRLKNNKEFMSNYLKAQSDLIDDIYTMAIEATNGE